MKKVTFLQSPSRDLADKRLETKPIPRLVPANPAYTPIDTEGLGVEIIGVIALTVRRLHP